MTDTVKRRSYDTAARLARSAETRQSILDVARTLFIERGYARTTAAAIASGAGVNVDTVYTLVGRKPVLVRELIEQALSGLDHAVDAEQRSHVVAMRAEPDPAFKLAIYARATRRVHARLAPLFLVLRDAGTSDPEAAGVWREISERRTTNMRHLVADVRSGATTTFEFSVSDAADIAWTLNSPETYVMLTAERRWTARRYERFLAVGLGRLILAEAGAPHTS